MDEKRLAELVPEGEVREFRLALFHRIYLVCYEESYACSLSTLRSIEFVVTATPAFFFVAEGLHVEVAW